MLPMMSPAEAARKIVDKAWGSNTISAIVAASPEPIRCMIYETYLVPSALDGTEYFHEVMDEIEKIY